MNIKEWLLAAALTIILMGLFYEALSTLNYHLALDTMCLQGETNHGPKAGYTYGELPPVTGVTNATQAARLCKEMGY